MGVASQFVRVSSRVSSLLRFVIVCLPSAAIQLRYTYKNDVYVEGRKYVQTGQNKHGLEVTHVCTNIKTTSVFQRRGKRTF